MTLGTISPDGQFYWNGAQWQSTQSVDGAWRWTGTDWVPIAAAPYSSPRSLGIVVSVLLAVSVATTLISTFVFEFYFHISYYVAGDEVVIYSIDLGGLVIFVVAAAFFLVWFHRSYRNLTSLGAQDLPIAADWAIGWWFVPVASLWMPFVAASEIWRGSDPNAPAITSADSRHAAGPAVLVTFWWAMWIISIVLVNVASVFVYPADNQWVLPVLSAAATALAGALAVAFVVSSSARENARWRRLLSPTSTPVMAAAPIVSSSI